MCHWSTLRLIYTWWVTLLMCRMGRLMTEWLRCLCQHLLWITDCLFHVKEQRIPFILATQHYFVGVEWRQGNRRLITVTCQRNWWLGYFIWNLWPAITNRQAYCTVLLTQDILNPNSSKIRFLVGEWCVHRTLCHPLPPCLEISQLISSTVPHLWHHFSSLGLHMQLPR